MKSKVSQRTVYLVTAVIVASMVSGFALAALGLGQTNTSYQGSQTTSVTHLQGLTWDFTALTVVNTSTQIAACSALIPSAACDVASYPKTVCAGSFDGSMCASGDFIEQVNLTTGGSTGTLPLYPTTTYPILVILTVYVTGTPSSGTDSGVAGTYAGSPLYFEDSAAPTGPVSIALDFDIGVIPFGPGGVTSVSVIATT